MYRWNPEEYSRHSSEQAKWARELIAKLNLQRTERVLDMGCGDGKVTVELASSLLQGSVLRIDSSPEMIAFAKDAFMDKFVNLAFQCVDVRRTSFTREFDIVFSNATLHWVADHASVLAKIRQSLGPLGMVLLQTAGKGNASAAVEVVNGMIRHEPWRAHFHDFPFPCTLYTDDEYKKLIKAAGFAVKRIELFPKTMLHKGREGFSGWIRTTRHPYLHRLPAKSPRGVGKTTRRCI
jgi:trans-aconitate 2-methyltransferase